MLGPVVGVGLTRATLPDLLDRAVESETLLIGVEGVWALEP